LESGTTTTSRRADEMTVRFPGGLRVEAAHGEQVIATDQSAANGGQGSAPAPFDLFLASIATCAGFYVLSFCRGRDIATEGLELGCVWERDPESRRLERIRLQIRLPDSFPRKYEEAVVRAAERCAVARALADPPRIEVGVGR